MWIAPADVAPSEDNNTTKKYKPKTKIETKKERKKSRKFPESEIPNPLQVLLKFVLNRCNFISILPLYFWAIGMVSAVVFYNSISYEVFGVYIC